MGGGKKENVEKKKEDMKDKKEGDKKDMEPSAAFKAAAKACTENKLCKQLMECMKKHTESGGKGDGKGDHEKVCVKEMEECAADKQCSMLHEKLQAAMKKDGGHGGKGGDGKGDWDKKGDDKKQWDQDKDGGDKKKPDWSKKDGDKKDDGKKGRQLEGHEHHHDDDDDHDDDDKKKDMDGKKDMEKKK